MKNDEWPGSELAMDTENFLCGSTNSSVLQSIKMLFSKGGNVADSVLVLSKETKGNE